jgi:hypothetical protein
VSIVIKVATMDTAYVTSQLCPLLSAYFSRACKVVFQSSSATYYGVDVSDLGYSRVGDIVKRDLRGFTASCKLVCDSTIMVNVDGNTRLRYRALDSSCYAL